MHEFLYKRDPNRAIASRWDAESGALYWFFHRSLQKVLPIPWAKCEGRERVAGLPLPSFLRNSPWVGACGLLISCRGGGQFKSLRSLWDLKGPPPLQLINAPQLFLCQAGRVGEGHSLARFSCATLLLPLSFSHEQSGRGKGRHLKTFPFLAEVCGDMQQQGKGSPLNAPLSYTSLFAQQGGEPMGELHDITMWHHYAISLCPLNAPSLKNSWLQPWSPMNWKGSSPCLLLKEIKMWRLAILLVIAQQLPQWPLTFLKGTDAAFIIFGGDPFF